MKRTIVHTEFINRPRTVRFFQIPLPSNAKKVTGILVTVNPEKEADLPPVGPNPGTYKRPEGLTTYAGRVLLSIPEKRDTFYAEEFRFPNHLEKQLPQISGTGFTSPVMGREVSDRSTFFKIDVPVENTIIEGIIWEQLKSIIADYVVRIYLEVELNKSLKPAIG